MPEGAVTAVIGSPPYASDTVHGRNGIDLDKTQRPGKNSQAAVMDGYGRTDGNLGHMPQGKPPDAIISRPPYADVVNGRGEGPGGRHDHQFHIGDIATKKSSQARYGESEGQMGGMAVVGSPPFEKQQAGGGIGAWMRGENPGYDYKHSDKHRNGGSRPGYMQQGDSPGQLSNDTGTTFWSAARVILEQCYQLLPPGGVAVWVCGDFVRNKERVHFGRQWLALCESVGFRSLEHIVAWKREPGPVQAGIFEDKDHTIDRVSFFRRLSINKAVAAEHWATLSEWQQGKHLATATADLWDEYKWKTTPQERPSLPTSLTIDTMRQYNQDLAEYDRWSRAGGDKATEPTTRRILDYAQVVAWVANGSEWIDVDSAILNEDVVIVQKP
jgi:hypothetical protein